MTAPLVAGRAQRADVPCNGCTACCRRDLIVLHPEAGDDPDAYETVEVVHPLNGSKALALAQGPDGSCVYLGPTGCTIHDRAPHICRTFDCRRFFLALNRTVRRRGLAAGIFDASIIAAGRARLGTLKGSRK